MEKWEILAVLYQNLKDGSYFVIIVAVNCVVL